MPNQAIATYVTQWTYDSHNRLLEMIYPDEEKVTYTYDLGGQLTNVHGYKSYGYDYVNRIGYDKFGQRTYMKYCNGAETFYTYEPQRRRLQGLKVDAGGRTIMDNAYTYDAVSNVLGVTNGAALPQSGKAGGQMSHSYTYDALYRLSGATGTYTGADSKTASYTLSMGYDNMHRITSKSQHLTQDNLQFDGTLNVGYDLAYTYGQDEGKKFQLANVGDVNYRTEAAPGEDGKVTNSHAYEYDANGNLVYVNTGRVKKDGGTDENAHERKLKWDEENRLLASDDDGFVTNYWYDADGERTVKTSGESEQVYVNSGFAGGRTNTAKFSLYVSPYLVANQGGRYTKHIYIGGERIVSKIGDFASYGPDPRRIEYAGSEADAVTVDYDVKYSQQLQAIKDNYATFGVPYNGTDNDDYVNGEGFCCDDGSLEAAQAKMVAQANALDGNFQEGDAYENLQFYYHADHLGSTSYITNLDGEVVQHVEYVPFGEVFIEERNNTWNTPYLFNAKEFDEETGLYYYGARYYDPRLSLWMSTDAMEEKYPNISAYCYAANNPILFIDPDGNKLVLQGTHQQRMELLATLQKLTNDNLFVNRKTGVVTVGKPRWDNINKNLSIGTKLIREIIKHQHTTTIKKNDDGIRQSTAENEWARINVPHPKGMIAGSNAHIDIDLSATTNRVRNPITGNVLEKMTDAKIILAHELIHSLRYMRGISRPSSETASYTYLESSNGTIGTFVKENEKTEELITIGLGNWYNKFEYNENKIRKEQSEWQRVSHNSDE